MQELPVTGRYDNDANTLLNQIARHTARNLGLPCVLITRMTGAGDQLRLGAFSIKGRARTRFDYASPGPPCPYQDVGSNCYACGASGRYPNCLQLAHTRERCFLGQQVRTPDGRVIGHIAAFDHQPLRNPQALADRLEYHATCVAAVLGQTEAQAETDKLLPALGMLSNMATRLLTLDAEALEGGITDIMSHVAHFFSAERACLYLLDDDGQRARLRYLWNDQGLWNNLPGEYFSCHRFPWLMSQLRDEQPIIVADSLALMETQARREGAILAQRGVHAFIDIPLFHHRHLNGFIGLDCQQAQPGWSLHAATVLNGVGHIIATTLREQGQLGRLDHTESLFQRLLELFQAPLLFIGADHRLMRSNPAATVFLGYPPEDLEGLHIDRLLPEFSTRDTDSSPLTTCARHRDGTEIPVYLSYVYGHESTAIMMHDLRPITERYDTLIRELHHRMKNQLQGLSGLLQETARRHPEIHDLLQDSITRLRSVALFNQQQVSGTDKATELQTLLHGLAEVIEEIHAVDIDLHVKPELATVVLEHGKWTCLGLILNELLTNAAKYGQDRHINLYCEPAMVTPYIGFRIENSAAGLPATLDLVNEQGLGQGLSLVMKLLPEGSTLRLGYRKGIVTAHLTYITF